MGPELYNKQKQTVAEFWKAYFAKFQRRVEDHEPSETLQAPLFTDAPGPLHFPERRVSGLRRSTSLRAG